MYLREVQAVYLRQAGLCAHGRPGVCTMGGTECVLSEARSVYLRRPGVCTMGGTEGVLSEARSVYLRRPEVCTYGRLGVCNYWNHREVTGVYLQLAWLCTYGRPRVCTYGRPWVCTYGGLRCVVTGITGRPGVCTYQMSWEARVVYLPEAREGPGCVLTGGAGRPGVCTYLRHWEARSVYLLEARGGPGCPWRRLCQASPCLQPYPLHREDPVTSSGRDKSHVKHHHQT